MNGLARLCLAAAMGLSLPLHAFGWGTVSGPHGGTATTGPRGAGYAQGPNGGTAYRGPRGAGYAQGPNGGTAYRGPAGAGAAYGPNGGTAYRGPYGGAVATGPNGGTAYRAPYCSTAPARSMQSGRGLRRLTTDRSSREWPWERSSLPRHRRHRLHPRSAGSGPARRIRKGTGTTVPDRKGASRMCCLNDCRAAARRTHPNDSRQPARPA